MSAFKSDGTLCLSWISDRSARIISLASPGQRKAHRVVAHSAPCIFRCSLSWQSPQDPSIYKCHRNGNVSHGFLRIVYENASIFSLRPTISLLWALQGCWLAPASTCLRRWLGGVLRSVGNDVIDHNLFQ